MSCFSVAGIGIRRNFISTEQDGWPLNGGPVMPEEDRAWDVINYLHSPKDAYLFLEAAAEDDEGDGIEIRNAWSHIARSIAL